MPHVGVIFDDGPRPETTGGYALRALQCLTDAVHLRPADLPQVDPNQFRLFLRVDDGLEYDIPPQLRPLAWWGIDTHLAFERCLKQAQLADLVFAAQKNGVQQLHQAGISNVHWLPLACDPVIHGRRQVKNRFDVAFVGNFFPGARTELLNLVLFNLGMTHADAGQQEEAIQYLQRCIQVSGKDESHLRKAYALLIGSLMQLQQTDEAQHCCTQGLRLFPDDKELLFRQAMLFHAAGRLEQAEQTYLRILQEQTERHFASVDLGITDYKTRHNLAIVYEDLGQPDIAQQVWNDILLTHPHYEPALRRLPRTAVLRAEGV